MIQPHEIKRVKMGKQTELFLAEDPKWRVGKARTVKPGLRITVRSIEQQEIAAMTVRDARKLGYRTTTALRAAWKGGKTGWRVRFDLGDTVDHPRLLRAASPQAPICTAILTFVSFGDPDNGVPDREWKVKCGRAFADHQDVCKCGHKRPAESPDDHGYTSSTSKALRSTGDEVSEALHGRYAANSGQRQAITLGERRKRLQEALAEIRSHTDDPLTNAKLRSAQERIRQNVPVVLYSRASTG